MFYTRRRQQLGLLSARISEDCLQLVLKTEYDVPTCADEPSGWFIAEDRLGLRFGAARGAASFSWPPARKEFRAIEDKVVESSVCALNDLDIG